MDRKEFLSLIGLSVGGMLAAPFLSRCEKIEEESAHSKKDFSLDLTNPENAALKSKGGYLITNGVIVAKTLSAKYIAVAAACTDNSNVNVRYDPPNNQFKCLTHEAIFSSSGSVLRGPAYTPLQEFNTSLNGNLLRIYS
jgi:cytochrome b6-f complex iron-sulfur subunit